MATTGLRQGASKARRRPADGSGLRRTILAVVGEEGRVIRLELVPLAYYATATGLLTLLFVYVLFPGVV
jgi:hypothetical protein